MSTYGWTLLLSALFPVIFSFHPKIRFYNKWAITLISGLAVSIPFWIWDAVATERGDWQFNARYVSSAKIVGLPIEEILFFLVVPFSCLFIWQILVNMTHGKHINIKIGVVPTTIVMVILTYVLRDKFYTSTILAWTVLTLLVIRWLDRELLNQAVYWRWIGITFIPFLVVNGILTYLPVVEYSNQAIMGVRFITIPIEDFLYSWSLLTLNLVVFKKLKGIIHQKVLPTPS